MSYFVMYLLKSFPPISIGMPLYYHIAGEYKTAYKPFVSYVCYKHFTHLCMTVFLPKVSQVCTTLCEFNLFLSDLIYHLLLFSLYMLLVFCILSKKYLPIP